MNKKKEKKKQIRKVKEGTPLFEKVYQILLI
jgi:hypothetical protein